MPRRCTICDNPRRSEIDAAVVAGGPVRAIARRFEVDRSAVRRHSKTHLRQTLLQADEKRIDHGATLLERLLDARRYTLEILAEARRARDPVVALAAILRIEKQLELEGRLLGEFERAEFASRDAEKIISEAAEAMGAEVWSLPPSPRVLNPAPRPDPPAPRAAAPAEPIASPEPASAARDLNAWPKPGELAQVIRLDLERK